jgi:hypothetical protein
MAEAAVQAPDVDPSTLYQAHRVFLYAGNVGLAAELVAMHNSRTIDLSSIVMVNVRQACAEGRVDEAEKEYLRLGQIGSGAILDNQWLFLKTLGRDDDARADVSSLDTLDGMFTLSGFLNYRSFDPADFPYLYEVLLAQGISRPPAQKIPFACNRDET